ncbi:MAG: hypothetical protein OEY28_00080 [Nitrospira sp.]|nr:hypothetical protein [Nitrospira sp.]
MIVEYASLQDKITRWPRETIPAILVAASQGATAVRASALGPDVARSLAELHNKMRAGRYVPELEPRDYVRPVAVTLRDGGDCEDWLAVGLAVACFNWGLPCLIATSGDERDPFQHTYLLAWDGRNWRTLDPKGSQTGVPFDVQSENNPVRQLWQWEQRPEGLQIVEVRG